jgi:hypothetical protein
MQLGRLRAIHADQRGGVQSLSFVLTLPLFAMIVMFIVQVSQLMIGRTMVEYAAFAAARSAVVWIPANLGSYGGESENRIAALEYLGEEPGSDGEMYSVYQVVPRSPKFDKIHVAAAMALLPICPSRDTGVSRAHPGNGAYPSLLRAYLATAPSQAANTRVPDRLANKLAYALANTNVRIEIRHKESEPPLAHWDVLPYVDEFQPNEIGWQDQILVTVRHDFALLPGPGRLLARPSGGSSSASSTAGSGGASSSTAASDPQGGSQSPPPTSNRTAADSIRNVGGTFVYTISSTVRLNNEGEKPVLPYVQKLDGHPAAGVLPLPEGSSPSSSNPSQPCIDCENQAG